MKVLGKNGNTECQLFRTLANDVLISGSNCAIVNIYLRGELSYKNFKDSNLNVFYCACSMTSSYSSKNTLILSNASGGLQ